MVDNDPYLMGKDLFDVGKDLFDVIKDLFCLTTIKMSLVFNDLFLVVM